MRTKFPGKYYRIHSSHHISILPIADSVKCVTPIGRIFFNYFHLLHLTIRDNIIIIKVSNHSLMWEGVKIYGKQH